MENIFSDRISDVPKSFIREILKVTIQPDVISFAGGLPNRDFFPLEQIRDSCNRVLDESGRESLQYSTTEGHLPLREFICNRYQQRGLHVEPDEILITNGSQQGLDLMAKTVINEGDSVIIERPGYLGAIQAFSVYRASFLTVNLEGDGPLVDEVARMLKRNPKLFYAVTNFQNPSGVTWSEEKRKTVADIMRGAGTLFVEDDPYGELRFSGEHRKSMKHFLPDNTVMLGSFSKVFAPSFRLGWIAARRDVMEKVIVAKQAADLHTNYFSQRVLYDYLAHNDLDAHIATIRRVYGSQRNAMVKALKKYMPDGTKWTEPEGGMFVWLMLPEGYDSMELFERAIEKKVAFVPGNPFYPGDRDPRTMRLNYSCSDEATIEEGVRRLASAL